MIINPVNVIITLNGKDFGFIEDKSEADNPALLPTVIGGKLASTLEDFDYFAFSSASNKYKCGIRFPVYKKTKSKQSRLVKLYALKIDGYLDARTRIFTRI